MKVSTASLLSIPLFSSFASAVTFDCSHIRVDGVKFDFSQLGGPHSLSVVDKERPPSVTNTTWTLDICKALERSKEIDKADQCQQGTYVCGIVKSYNPIDDPDQEHVQIENVISVAGSFTTSDGKSLEPHYERLKSKDTSKEGLELELNGGTYDKRKQQAIIRFECDPKRSGNEEKYDATSKMRRRADDDNDRDNNDDEVDDQHSLTYESYGPEEGKGTTDVLRLKWKTKYACEDYVEEEGDKKAGWGFFTWFILLLFLGIAAYLIFGSWLNYNRYGARGWDLLPHGDTIRDVPYLFKDWSRKVIDTVSGSGSRGGYSAV